MLELAETAFPTTTLTLSSLCVERTRCSMVGVGGFAASWLFFTLRAYVIILAGCPETQPKDRYLGTEDV